MSALSQAASCLRLSSHPTVEGHWQSLVDSKMAGEGCPLVDIEDGKEEEEEEEVAEEAVEGSCVCLGDVTLGTQTATA